MRSIWTAEAKNCSVDNSEYLMSLPRLLHHLRYLHEPASAHLRYVVHFSASISVICVISVNPHPTTISLMQLPCLLLP